MKLFTKVSRAVQAVVGVLALGAALLLVPGGAAHAATADCQNDLAQRKPGVYLFSDINFQGDCQYLTVYYIGNNLGDVGNDRASSMKIIPDPRYSTIVSLYQNTNSGGAMWTTSADGSSDTNVLDFRQHTMTLGKNLNDRVSSISVWPIL